MSSVVLRRFGSGLICVVWPRETVTGLVKKLIAVKGLPVVTIGWYWLADGVRGMPIQPHHRSLHYLSGDSSLVLQNSDGWEF